MQGHPALGFFCAGALEIDDAHIVGNDDHAQLAAVGFGQFIARRGDAIDRLPGLDLSLLHISQPPRPD